MLKNVFLFLFILLLSCSFSAARAEQWDVQFCHNSVNNVYLRGDTLWCCTDGGVLVYSISDSVFSHYGSQLQMRSTHVDALTFSQDGSMWLGFESHGIARIENPLTDPDISWFSTETGLIDDRILSVERVGDEVYYGSESGIGKFFQNLPSREAILSDFLENERINDILALNDSIFWIASSGGATRFNRLSLHYDHYGIDEPMVSLSLHQGDIYCASDDSIFVFDGEEWSAMSGIIEVDGATYTSSFVELDSDGSQLYCITDFALYRWSGSWWAAVDRWAMKSTFTENYRSGWNFDLSALEIDGEGNPWIGAINRQDDRGVNLYLYDWADSQWVNRRPEQISYNNIMKVKADPGGGVWMSMLTNGICYYSSLEGYLPYTHLDDGSGEGLSSIHTNLAIVCDSNGRFWCHAFGDPVLGSAYPVDMIDLGDRTSSADDEWAHYSHEAYNISIRHQNAVEDPAGNIWFLSDDVYPEEAGEGIDILRNSADQWIHVNPDNTAELPSGNITDCAFTDTEAYVAVKNHGIMKWTTGGFEWNNLNGGGIYWSTLLRDFQLPSTDLRALKIRNGNLWIATSAGVVRRSSGGDLRRYSTNELDRGRRLLSNNVNDIELDRYGKVWVATDNGLNVIGAEGDVDFAYTSYDRWSGSLSGMYPYSIISPLVSSVCNSLAYDQSSDMMYVGTRNGLMGVDAEISLFSEASLTRAILYPNPAVPGEGDSGINISRIAGRVDVEVFNIEGELVHRKDNVSEGEQIWDLLNMNGYRAESGVYLVRISNDEGYELRKVAVIR